MSTRAFPVAPAPPACSWFSRTRGPPGGAPGPGVTSLSQSGPDTRVQGKRPQAPPPEECPRTVPWPLNSCRQEPRQRWGGHLRSCGRSKTAHRPLQQTSVFWFWMLDVQDQGVHRPGFSCGPSPRLADGRPHLVLPGARVCPNLLFPWEHRRIDWGPPRRPRLTLISSLKTPPPHPEVRGFRTPK